MIRILIFALFLLPSLLHGQSLDVLKGEWRFGLDPIDVGVEQGWHKPDFTFDGWDKVTIPHSYSVDPRYHNFTGKAWYFKRFSKIDLPAGHRAIIRFEAVFYRAVVWLNGKEVVEHEGGYTPFEVDVTEFLEDKNTLTIRVDNAWDTTTIPGAKTQVSYQGENMSQFFPWINYGGITRNISFRIRPGAYVRNVRIVAAPDLKKSARVDVEVFIKNRLTRVVGKNEIQVSLYRAGEKVPASFKTTGGDVAAGIESRFTFQTTLTGKDVQLWNIDEPRLYLCEVIVGSDTTRVNFGIRKVEVRGTKLLLNGEEVALGGCNRPLDSPGYGSMDPQEVLEKDLTLIKSGGMELSRISHYPVSSALLDWADEHGLLIIAEPGNWQMTPKQLSDPVMRAKFQAQMREMMERDWNHPSVIAWSVGNEYQSHTDEGQAWTRDMYDFAKSIDPTRLVTFASFIVGREHIQKPEDEASQYVDFISVNIYGNHLKTLERIHRLFPDKPIYVSEFGIRTDGVSEEQQRIGYLQNALKDFRQCDYVIGASIWTFNDYKSVFPGSNANGYRPWGLVSPEREVRGMYIAWQKEFAPLVEIKRANDGGLAVSVTSRPDFPRQTLRNYRLRVGSQWFEVPLLAPGQTKTFAVPFSALAGNRTFALKKPGGFVILEEEISN